MATKFYYEEDYIVPYQNYIKFSYQPSKECSIQNHFNVIITIDNGDFYASTHQYLEMRINNLNGDDELESELNGGKDENDVFVKSIITPLMF